MGKSYKKVLILLALFGLTGCATVNYNYRGRKCQVISQSKDRREVTLSCPQVIQVEEQ